MLTILYSKILFICIYEAYVFTPFTDHHLMYQASVSNAINVWGKETTCVGEMMQQGHILSALATLMYSTHQLQQVLCYMFACNSYAKNQMPKWISISK